VEILEAPPTKSGICLTKIYINWDLIFPPNPKVTITWIPFQAFLNLIVILSHFHNIFNREELRKLYPPPAQPQLQPSDESVFASLLGEGPLDFRVYPQMGMSKYEIASLARLSSKLKSDLNQEVVSTTEDSMVQTHEDTLASNDRKGSMEQDNVVDNVVPSSSATLSEEVYQQPKPSVTESGDELEPPTEFSSDSPPNIHQEDKISSPQLGNLDKPESISEVEIDTIQTDAEPISTISTSISVDEENPTDSVLSSGTTTPTGDDTYQTENLSGELLTEKLDEIANEEQVAKEDEIFERIIDLVENQSQSGLLFASADVEEPSNVSDEDNVDVGRRDPEAAEVGTLPVQLEDAESILVDLETLVPDVAIDDDGAISMVEVDSSDSISEIASQGQESGEKLLLLATPVSLLKEAVVSNASRVPSGRRGRRYSLKQGDDKFKAWRRLCLHKWDDIANSRLGNAFLHAVKRENEKNYARLIREPMDLKIMKQRVREGAIHSTEEFHRDLMLMIANSCMYYPPGTDQHTMAHEMKADIDQQMIQFRSVESAAAARMAHVSGGTSNSSKSLSPAQNHEVTALNSTLIPPILNLNSKGEDDAASG
jgi:hypothetical protein